MELNLVYLWLIALGAAMVAFVARMGWVLFGSASEPPEDPLLVAKWKRKRAWLLVSEGCALPLFATTAVLANMRGWVDPVLAVLYALVCSLLGFAFFLKTTKRIIASKLGMSESDES